MNTPMKPYQALFDLCRNPEIENDVREVNEILGFICVIAASPESRELQDWFPFLWTHGQDPSFSSERLAVDFASAVLQFYKSCVLNYQQLKPLILPTELWLNEQQEETAQGMAFASGYLAGFHHIEADWQTEQLAPGSEGGQLLQTTILLLSKMAAAESHEPQMQELFEQLPGLPEIVSSLPSLLTALGNYSAQVDINDEIQS